MQRQLRCALSTGLLTPPSTNIGNAKIGGMLSDLNMSSNGYSLVLSIFYAGYLIFEVPSNMLLSRSQPRIYLPMLMVIWVGAALCGVL